MKIYYNIKSWFKRNVFVTPLKPRNVLTLSLITIIIASLVLFVEYVAGNDYFISTLYYGDNLEEGNSINWWLMGFIAVICIIIIIVCLTKIIKMAVASIRKKREARKSLNHKPSTINPEHKPSTINNEKSIIH